MPALSFIQLRLWLLIRDEKVSAVHSGDAVDYSILPIDKLLKTVQEKLDARFPGNQFENGYSDHSLTQCILDPTGSEKAIYSDPIPNYWMRRANLYWRQN